MNAFINFIMGPMVWISALVFLFGLVFKLVKIILEIREKESFIFSYMSLKYSLRSMGAWLIPFYPESTKLHPVFWGISYLFHVFLFAAPLFLASHIILLDEAFQISWLALPDGVADIFTLLVILALVFFGVRRVVVPEVKFLTSAMDYILLILVMLPFLTGFLAYHQIFLYKWIMIAHILSGELLLIVIPFSRFSHMLTAPLTRAYTGSEFGNVRHARDW